MLIDLDEFLGVPFKVHGRNSSGYDCYGLVIAVEKKLGHTIVDLDIKYTNENYMQLMNCTTDELIKKNKLTKVDELHLGDIILFFDEKGRATHVGVFLKNKDFIHCDKYGVRISQLDNYFRKKWIGYTYGNNKDF